MDNDTNGFIGARDALECWLDLLDEFSSRWPQSRFTLDGVGSLLSSSRTRHFCGWRTRSHCSAALGSGGR